MNEFKVGDIVECIKKSALGHAGIVGSIHVVTRAEIGTIWFDGEEAGADVGRFKLYTPKTEGFTKASLKDGMAVTLRNGWMRTVDGGELLTLDGDHVSFIYEYAEDLVSNSGFSSLDIIKVEQTVTTTLYERQENTAAQQKIEELKESAKKLAEQIAELEASL